MTELKPALIDVYASDNEVPQGCCATLNHLSCLSKVFLVFLVFLGVVLGVINPQMFAAGPLILLPSCAFGFWYARKKRAGVPLELDMFVRLFAGGFVPGAIVVVIVELVVGLVFFFICFNNQLSGWKSILEALEADPANSAEIMKTFTIDKTFGFYAFIFILSYVVAGLCEETMKYSIVKRIKRNRPVLQDYDVYLFYAFAPALGFSTIENLGYAVISSGAAVTAIERIFVSTPLHLLCGHITALQLVRKEVFGEKLNYFQMIWRSVLLHGTFDLALFFVMVSNPDVAEQLTSPAEGVSIIVAIVLLVVAIVYVGYARKLFLAKYVTQGAQFSQIGTGDDDDLEMQQNLNANGNGDRDVTDDDELAV